tara:strand:- start:303 stop:968 length:666 start_codon:yes stop_codon:yes gene_type:complete
MKKKKILDIDQLITKDHQNLDLNTPLRDDAFDITDEEKINKIEHYFKKIMHTLGLDLLDDNLKNSPRRVAKMYVNELFSGLKPDNKPVTTLFENSYEYGKMLIEKNISFYSNCEHHFLPIVGKAHIGYISSGNVIGLSKLHRIVNYYAKRPQVQERMTVQIFTELKRALNTEDVAVILDASHLCVSSRGIKDSTSTTVTFEAGGKFKEEKFWKEFKDLIKE